MFVYCILIVDGRAECFMSKTSNILGLKELTMMNLVGRVISSQQTGASREIFQCGCICEHGDNACRWAWHQGCQILPLHFLCMFTRYNLFLILHPHSAHDSLCQNTIVWKQQFKKSPFPIWELCLACNLQHIHFLFSFVFVST